MEVIFKGTYLCSNIHSLHDNTLLYSISTTNDGMFGIRDVTTIRSTCDVLPVGAIYWKEGRFEVYGKIAPIGALRSKEGGLFNFTTRWKWVKNSYKVCFRGCAWTADLNGSIEALFHPHRFHFFRKTKPAKLQISRAAKDDEIFLMLVFLYSEIKRQDSQGNGYFGAG